MNIETHSPYDVATVALIEDDQHLRRALAFQIGTVGYQVAEYPSAESFLEARGPREFECLIADICLPKMNGLQLLAELKRSVPFVSIVLITGHGNMLIGVRAMREGAVDCLEKPFEEDALLNAIRRGIDLSRTRRAEHLRHLELKKREGCLTPREREVFVLITSGLLNKQVGAKLGPTEQTIKKHRGRVMKKMSADSLADLVRMAEILKL
jgi:FixJ family two-component response regulator